MIIQNWYFFCIIYRTQSVSSAVNSIQSDMAAEAEEWKLKK